MENQVEFKVFTKGKLKFYQNPNLVVYPLLGMSLGILYIAEKFDIQLLEKTGIIFSIITGIVAVVYLIIDFYSIEPLGGDLNKRIIFKPDEIIIDGNKYPLNEIKKISFKANDYYDGILWPTNDIYLRSTNSNGTHNYCTLYLTNGQKIETRFQLMHPKAFANKMREILIEYYAQGKLHFLNLIDLLGIQKYEDIQEFKKTLPPLKTTTLNISKHI